jgi:hypothetical protein
MAELLLLLFALLALGSPTVSICFLLVAIGASVWRQSNLRKELAQFREESSKQNDTLHRELIDLKRQLAASVRPAQEHARDGSVSEKLGDVPKVPSRAEEPSSAAVKEPTEVPARAGPREPESLSPKIAARMAEALKADTDAGVNVPVPPVSTSSGPPHPTAAAQSPTFASVPRTSEAEAEETAPAIAPAGPRALVAPSPVPPAQRPTKDKPQSFRGEAPVASAHPVEIPAPPSVPSHTQTTVPRDDRPTLQQRLRNVSLLEETLGTNWLSKLGIIMIHAENPEDELSQLAIASLTGYFRSHPLPSERLAQARSLILQEHWQDMKLQKPFHV